MIDRFHESAASLSGPAAHAFAITPQDGADLAETIRAIYCGVGGDLAVQMLSGAVVTLRNVSPGHILPLRVTRVLQTGTTATDLVGLV